MAVNMAAKTELCISLLTDRLHWQMWDRFR